MKTDFTLNVRAFPVKVFDHRSNSERVETVVLTKEHLQASQIVGQSSKELIQRLCAREGFSVLGIGTPEKKSISLNLDELFNLYNRSLSRK